MIKFRCYQTPKEHLRNWLRQEHELPTVLENKKGVVEVFIQMEEMKMKRKEMKYPAEKHYANAVLCDRKGDSIGTIYHGSRTVSLYQRIRIKTLEDATPTRMRTRGVELPDIMHEEVGRQRLGL